MNGTVSSAAIGLCAAVALPLGMVALTEHHDGVVQKKTTAAAAVSALHGWSALQQNDDGSPITWNSCQPIHYVINPDQAPEGSTQIVQEGIAEISKDSGLTFIYDGESNELHSADREVRQDRYGDRWAPVLITWSDIPDTAKEQSILGQASPVSAKVDGKRRYISGTVEFDSFQLQNMTNTEGDADFLRGVVEHEVGHIVGLGHVENTNLLMNPEITQKSPQSGDLQGLRRMGAGGCS